MDIQGIWRRGLEKLRDRNGPLGVSVCSKGDQMPADQPTYRMRLLELSADGTLLLERPSICEPNAKLTKGTIVHLLLDETSQRWMGISEVLGLTTYQLNKKSRVRAVRCSRAVDVQSAQRRAFFRAQTVAAQIKAVIIEPIPLQDQDPSPDQPPGPNDALLMPMEGRMINVGGGGIGVCVNLSLQQKHMLKKHRYFRCTIELPSLKLPIEVAAHLVHMQRADAKTTYLGLEFDTSDISALRKAQDQIVRFTTWIQQRQIRRQRRA